MNKLLPLFASALLLTACNNGTPLQAMPAGSWTVSFDTNSNGTFQTVGTVALNVPDAQGYFTGTFTGAGTSNTITGTMINAGVSPSMVFNIDNGVQVTCIFHGLADCQGSYTDPKKVLNSSGSGKANVTR